MCLIWRLPESSYLLELHNTSHRSVWTRRPSQPVGLSEAISETRDVQCQHIPLFCQSVSPILLSFPSICVKVETLQNEHHRMMFISVCVCFLPLHVRLISSLFITVTYPSTVNWTSGCGVSQRTTLPSPICPGNFSVPLRSNLPILPPLRLYLSVTDRANTGKQTAIPSSNRIRDCGASVRSVSLLHLLQ